MIRINLLTDESIAALKLNRAVAAAVNAIRSRSFSGRNPQLGKMINCAVCDKRHRNSIVCTPKYGVGRYDPEKKPLVASDKTARGILGAARFAKVRFHPHHSHKLLQLVQRTQQIFPQFAPYLTDPEECMKESRKEAARQLKTERDANTKIKRQQQQIARRINFGLARPGSRP